MFALVEPSGRISQVENEQFPIAPPLQWVEVPAGTTTEHRFVGGVLIQPQPSEWHDLIDGQWVEDTAAKQAFEAEQAKTVAYIGNALRQEVVQRFKNDTPAELEAYVRSKINADAVVDLATAKTFAKRMETFAVIISLAVALSNRN